VSVDNKRARNQQKISTKCKITPNPDITAEKICKATFISTSKRSSVGKKDLATAKTLDKRTGSLSLNP